MVAELSPSRWETDLQRLRAGAEFDLLVVGGGVVGAGAALDAAGRGLSVVLVEARDFAFGTSSRSSKLIHGGLRYLKRADFKLVREALRERGLLLELAPHLVRPLPFLYVLRHRVVERIYVTLGLGIYDLMARIGNTGQRLPRHRQLSRRSARVIAPGLGERSFIGAVQYHDAQVDDSRFVLSLVRSAVSCGAVALNGMKLTGVNQDGKTTLAHIENASNGEELTVRVGAIVVATGVWSERTMALLGPSDEVAVHPSKGVHLVIARSKFTSSSALIVPTKRSVLFVLPWYEHWIVGTTDTDWRYDIDDVTASSSDVDYLLEQVNAICDAPLSRDDVDGVYVGLRPLVAAAGLETTKLSREHAIGRPTENAVVVSGGKFTTYRLMAKEAVDAATECLSSSVSDSRTDKTPLFGATRYQELWSSRAAVAERSGLALQQVEKLLSRYGDAVEEILEMIENDRQAALPLSAAPSYLRAEVVHAVSHEGARHLGDVLRRRFHIAIEEKDRGVTAAIEIAPLIAPLLSWDDAATTEEVEAYRRSVEHELVAEENAEPRPIEVDQELEHGSRP